MNDEISSLILNKIAKIPKSLFSFSILLIGGIILLGLMVTFSIPFEGYYKREYNFVPKHSQTDSVAVKLPSFVVENIRKDSIVYDSDEIVARITNVDQRQKKILLKINCGQKYIGTNLLLNLKIRYITNVYNGLLKKKSQ